MGPAVVQAAERDAVGEVGGSTGGPRVRVVDVAPGERPLAALGRAGVVADRQGPTLGDGVQPALAAEVERLRPGPEHGRDDPRVAGEPAGRAGRERTPVSRPADASPSRRCWWSRCTSTPTPTREKPPALPSGLVGRCSSSSVNPSPIRSDQDRFWAPVLTSRVSSVTGSPSRPPASRRGEVICSSQARSRWPCSSGITNRPTRCRRPGRPASATSRSPHAAPRPPAASPRARRPAAGAGRPRRGRSPRSRCPASAAPPGAAGGRPSPAPP